MPTRERDVLRLSQCLKQNGICLLPATIGNYVIRGLEENGIDFGEPHRPDDLHRWGSPSLQAAQFVTIEYNVLVGLDLIAAENVRSGNWLLIACSDQSLSDACNRSWESRCFRFRRCRGGFEPRRSRFRFGGFRAASAHRRHGRRRSQLWPMDVMQAQALPSRGAE